MTRYAVATIATMRKTRNQFPMSEVANAWTLLMTPLRVMNVPRIARRKVAATSVTFHFLSIPRFS